MEASSSSIGNDAKQMSKQNDYDTLPWSCPNEMRVQENVVATGVIYRC